jgi:hypothetical protein
VIALKCRTASARWSERIALGMAEPTAIPVSRATSRRVGALAAAVAALASVAARTSSVASLTKAA